MYLCNEIRCVTLYGIRNIINEIYHESKYTTSIILDTKIHIPLNMNKYMRTEKQVIILNLNEISHRTIKTPLC